MGTKEVTTADYAGQIQNAEQQQGGSFQELSGQPTRSDQQPEPKPSSEPQQKDKQKLFNILTVVSFVSVVVLTGVVIYIAKR